MKPGKIAELQSGSKLNPAQERVAQRRIQNRQSGPNIFSIYPSGTMSVVAPAVIEDRIKDFLDRVEEKYSHLPTFTLDSMRTTRENPDTEIIETIEDEDPEMTELVGFQVEQGMLLRYLPYLPKVKKEKAGELISLIESGMSGAGVLFAPVAIDKKYIYIARRTKKSLGPEIEEVIARAFNRQIRYLSAQSGDIRQMAGIFLKVGIYSRKKATVQDSVVNGSKISEFVDNLIALAVRMQATDIHVNSAGRFTINFRIDGELRQINFVLPQPDLKTTSEQKVINRIKIISGLNVLEKRRAQDGSLTGEYAGKKISIRVSTEQIEDGAGEKAVLRLLWGTQSDSPNKKELTLEDLGLSEQEIFIIKQLKNLRQGFILFAGPTGSGKSTSLHAILSSINDGKKNIITIEDPIEYHLPGATQIQVAEELGKTFPEILKRTLRADPDVVLVGEIRDLETAETAVSAASTGHLVFSTVHAESSAAVFKRLISLGLNPDLASSIVAVISQRLVPTICDCCKTAYVPSAEELNRLGIERDALEDGVLFKGRGCPACQQTGKLGRVGVFEIMLVEDQIRQLVLTGQGNNTDLIERTAITAGMRTMEADIKRKLLAGNISAEEAIQLLSSYRDLSYRVQKIGEKTTV